MYFVHKFRTAKSIDTLSEEDSKKLKDFLEECDEKKYTEELSLKQALLQIDSAKADGDRITAIDKFVELANLKFNFDYEAPQGSKALDFNTSDEEARKEDEKKKDAVDKSDLT
jgi:hypothetical protein